MGLESGHPEYGGAGFGVELTESEAEAGRSRDPRCEILPLEVRAPRMEEDIEIVPLDPVGRFDLFVVEGVDHEPAGGDEALEVDPEKEVARAGVTAEDELGEVLLAKPVLHGDLGFDPGEPITITVDMDPVEDREGGAPRR